MIDKGMKIAEGEPTVVMNDSKSLRLISAHDMDAFAKDRREEARIKCLRKCSSRLAR